MYNDYRVGNFVLIDGEVEVLCGMKVLKDFSPIYYIENRTIKEEFVCPLPMSERWLIDANFVSSGSIWDNEVVSTFPYVLKIDDFLCISIEDDWSVCFTNTEEGLGSFITPSLYIPYVHKMQNLIETLSEKHIEWV